MHGTEGKGALRMIATLGALPLAGCGGEQSMFSPAGSEATRVVYLYWTMVTASVVIFAFVAGCLWVALRGTQRWRQRLGNDNAVFGLGLIFPVVILTVLLIWGFWLLGIAAGHTRDPDLLVRIEGEQWWWRITYVGADGEEVETANELRIPTGAEVLLELTSADVLHSFWIPPWAGKVDMVPGRTNFLRLSVDQPGIVRGQCAEYCGGAHALMGLHGVAMQPDEFSRWLESQRGPAADTAEPEGRSAFLSNGCGACHAVRGEAAPGGSGPDLTHVGSRLAIGAGVLPNDTEALERWLALHPVIKPDNHMPAFGFLSDEERQAMAAYLSALQ